MRGPRWQRPPMQFVNPNIKDPHDRISYASNGWGFFDFLDVRHVAPFLPTAEACFLKAVLCVNCRCAEQAMSALC